MVLALALAAVACTAAEDVPRLERRAQALNKAVMCPVCPGESIDQSQNPLAVQMRAIVAEKMEEGWSEGQIKDFFVERYGPSVLLEPRRSGFTLLVWVLPPVAAVGAALALLLTLRLMRRSPAPQPEGASAAVALSEQERDEYFRRIEAALDFDSSAEARDKDREEPGPQPGGAR